MYLSDKKTAELYNAIYEPIMQERVRLAKNPVASSTFDDSLASLKNQIWLGIHKALNLEGPA